MIDGIVDEIGEGIEQKIAVAGHENLIHSRDGKADGFFLRGRIEELDHFARQCVDPHARPDQE